MYLEISTPHQQDTTQIMADVEASDAVVINSVSGLTLELSDIRFMSL